MSYIDIAIIAIVVLMAIIGLAKGFFKTIISFFGWLVSAIIAIFLSKVVAEALLDVGAIKNFVVGTGESFSLYKTVFNWLPESMDAAWPDGFLGTILAPLQGMIMGGVGSTAATIREACALVLANGMFTAMVGIGLFIAIRIVMMLFTMFAKSLTRNKTIGALNRFMGFIVGAVKGFAYVCILMLIMSFFMSANFMEPVRNQLDKSVIGKPVANVVYKLRDKYILGDDGIFNRLLEYAGFKSGEEGGGDEGGGDEVYQMTPDEATLKELIDSFIEKPADYMGTPYDAQLQSLLDYNKAMSDKLAAEGAGDTDLIAIVSAFRTRTENETCTVGDAIFDLTTYISSYKTDGQNDPAVLATAVERIEKAFADIKTQYGALGVETLFGTLTYPGEETPAPEPAPEPEPARANSFLPQGYRLTFTPALAA